MKFGGPSTTQNVFVQTIPHKIFQTKYINLVELDRLQNFDNYFRVLSDCYW